MSQNNMCPECGEQTIMMEYGRGDKYRYDGVSEYACRNALKLTRDMPNCKYRVGRWCGQQLEAGMVEPPFCNGGSHPRVMNLEDEKEE